MHFVLYVVPDLKFVMQFGGCGNNGCAVFICIRIVYVICRLFNQACLGTSIHHQLETGDWLEQKTMFVELPAYKNLWGEPSQHGDEVKIRAIAGKGRAPGVYIRYLAQYDGEPGFWTAIKRSGDRKVLDDTIASEANEWYSGMLGDTYNAIANDGAHGPPGPENLQRPAALARQQELVKRKGDAGLGKATGNTRERM